MLAANKFLLTSKHVSGLSLQRCLQSPQVSIVRAELGEAALTTIVMKAINELCVLTNSDMVVDAKAMLANSIINDFWYMRIDEILLTLSDGMKKKHGEIYGQLNYQTIYGWFLKHDTNRDEHFYNQHEEKKNSFGNNADRSPEPKLAKDVFEQMVDQRVNYRIEKYKEASKEKKTWSDTDTAHAADAL